MNGTLLKTYSEFDRVLTSTLKLIEAEGFQISRADMSLNSDNPNDYETFKKLNRLLICCLAQHYHIRNCYSSYDLWSDKSLSVAIKSDTIEAENFNKEIESQGTVDTTNRLELRSKGMTTNDLKKEFTVKWFKRLDNAVDEFDNVQERYNKELIRIWNEDNKKPPKERDFISATAFILKYKNCIFTRRQLEELFRQMGYDNYKSKAKKFKEKHHIEFFSLTDLRVIVKGIKNAIKDYFKE